MSHPPRARLVVITGPDQGAVFPLDERVCRLGTGLKSNHENVSERHWIRLTDPYVSRAHTGIRFRDGHYELADLDSTSGTLLNKCRIAKSPLTDGDVIRIGKTDLRFELVKEHDTAEAKDRKEPGKPRARWRTIPLSVPIALAVLAALAMAIYSTLLVINGAISPAIYLVLLVGGSLGIGVGTFFSLSIWLTLIANIPRALRRGVNSAVSYHRRADRDELRRRIEQLYRAIAAPERFEKLESETWAPRARAYRWHVVLNILLGLCLLVALFSGIASIFGDPPTVAVAPWVLLGSLALLAGLVPVHSRLPSAETLAKEARARLSAALGQDISPPAASSPSTTTLQLNPERTLQCEGQFKDSRLLLHEQFSRFAFELQLVHSSNLQEEKSDLDTGDTRFDQSTILRTSPESRAGCSALCWLPEAVRSGLLSSLLEGGTLAKGQLSFVIGLGHSKAMESLRAQLMALTVVAHAYRHLSALRPIQRWLHALAELPEPSPEDRSVAPLILALRAHCASVTPERRELLHQWLRSDAGSRSAEAFEHLSPEDRCALAEELLDAPDKHPALRAAALATLLIEDPERGQRAFGDALRDPSDTGFQLLRALSNPPPHVPDKRKLLKQRCATILATHAEPQESETAVHYSAGISVLLILRLGLLAAAAPRSSEGGLLPAGSYSAFTPESLSALLAIFYAADDADPLWQLPQALSAPLGVLLCRELIEACQSEASMREPAKRLTAQLEQRLQGQSGQLSLSDRPDQGAVSLSENRAAGELSLSPDEGDSDSSAPGPEDA